MLYTDKDCRLTADESDELTSVVDGFNSHMDKLDDILSKDDKRRFLDWLLGDGFFSAPASTKYHSSVPGGLVVHSIAVADALTGLTERLGLKWERSCSPHLIGLFHDLCKIDQYKKAESFGLECFTTVPNYEYCDDQLIKGHGDKSIMLLSQFVTLTMEEILCIRYHMGTYVKEDWDGFDRAITRYPNVLYTHTADMVASKVYKV